MSALTKTFLLQTVLLLLIMSSGASHAKEKSVCNSISNCTPLAQNNNLEAQYILGILHTKQKKSDSNRKAFYWIRKAAKKGYVPAQFSLGVIYSEGLGEEVKPDDITAFNWYNKAAQKSHPDAQYATGMMLMQSKSIETNYKLAAKWLSDAASQEHAKAQFSLGTLYFAGLGVKQSFKKALKWYTKSSDNGHTEAQFNVGMMHYQGQGTNKNIRKGLQEIQLAASKGDYNAMHFLRSDTSRA